MIAIAFALVGAAGPLLAVGFASPWLMTPAAVVGAADLSLMVSHWSWVRRKGVHALAGWGLVALLGGLIVALPVTRDTGGPLV